MHFLFSLVDNNVEKDPVIVSCQSVSITRDYNVIPHKNNVVI